MKRELLHPLPRRPAGRPLRRPLPRPLRRLVRRRGEERGSVSIELVIVLPALFAVMFLGMQAALYYHARAVAIAAAQQGARAAAAENGHDTDGTTAATAFIAEAGGDGVLEHTSTTVTRSQSTASVTIHATSLSVIPGWHPAITQSASAPLERVTAP